MKDILLKSFAIMMLLIGSQMTAQEFQGVAEYQTKTKMNIDFSGSGMPADRIKMIEERMKSRLEQTYKLSFDKSASIYKQEEKLDQPTGGGRGGMRFMAIGGNGSGKYYKNTQTKGSSRESEFSGKFFLIKDDLTTYEWKMEQETKMIGNYMCFKATTVIQMPVRDMRVRMGRGNRNDDENEENENSEPEMEDVIVTAWYTLDIPVNHGPDEYWGLPGLILEVADRDTQILCTKVVLNPKEKAEISEPKKGKVVSQEEYDKIIREKMQEMRERMRNERQKGGDNRRTIRIGG